MTEIDPRKSGSSHSTRRTINPEDFNLNIEEAVPLFSLADIKAEIIGILSTESIHSAIFPLIKNSKSLTETLLLLWKLSTHEDKLNGCSGEKLERNKSIFLGYQKEIDRLKKSVDEKNEAIMKLSEGYNEARKYFEEDILEKEKVNKQLKTQIFKLKNEISIFHQRKQASEVLNSVKTKRMKRLSECPMDSRRENSTDSHKSQYKEIKSMLEEMNEKITGIEGQNSRIHRRSIGGSMVGANHQSFLNSRKISYHSKNDSLLLNEEVKQLRENQSKLLGKICEQDKIIEELWEVLQSRRR